MLNRVIRLSQLALLICLLAAFTTGVKALHAQQALCIRTATACELALCGTLCEGYPNCKCAQ
jgi:hypothetical protein